MKIIKILSSLRAVGGGKLVHTFVRAELNGDRAFLYFAVCSLQVLILQSLLAQALLNSFLEFMPVQEGGHPANVPRQRCDHEKS